jgi:hypothetical protein
MSWNAKYSDYGIIEIQPDGDLIRRNHMTAAADRQLEDIRRLLVLLLMKLGSPSEEIALALQVDSSAVRKLISARKVKKVVSERDG